MTVRKLIQLLQGQNPRARVRFLDNDNWQDRAQYIDEVESVAQWMCDIVGDDEVAAEANLGEEERRSANLKVSDVLLTGSTIDKAAARGREMRRKAR